MRLPTAWFLALVAGQAPQFGIEQLIPVGRVQVEVLQLTAPEPYPTWAARFQESMRQNRSWFEEWIKKSGPGPLPWSPKMGLSRDEYETFLSLSQQLRFKRERLTTISSRRQGRAFLLDGGDDLPDLWEIVIDPVSMTVHTPLGGCSAFRWIEPSAKATGPWRGYTCSQFAGDVAKGDGQSVVFHIGRLTESGRVFFSLQAKRMRGRDQLERLDVSMRYATP